MSYFGVPVRNGLPIGLGSVAGFGVQQFSPADLFSAGEQGAWYDPSDLTTLFTDSAGTTPVTAVEQFVGLMLDKSRGTPTARRNRFSYTQEFNQAAWELFGGASKTGTDVAIAPDGTLTADSIRVTTAGTGSNVYQSFAAGAITANTWTISVWVKRNAASDQTFQLFANVRGATPYGVSGNFTATDTWQRFTFTHTETGGTSGSVFGIIGNTSGVTANLLVWGAQLEASSVASEYQKIVSGIGGEWTPGNHATSTGTKRPKLAARYNLLEYTEDFSNAVWAKRGFAAPVSGQVDPNGGTTAWSVTENNTDNNPALFFATGINDTVSRTYRVWLRASSSISIALTTQGAVSPGNINVTTSWQEFSVTQAVSSSLSGGPHIGGFSTIARNSGVTIFVWHPDLRPASQATGLIGPTYQRVAAATDYNSSGFLPYLAFDGVDDSMLTNSVDFTATDKMTVWQGLRQLNNVTGMIVELSANGQANAGAFYTINDTTVAIFSRGSVLTGVTDPTTMTAPLTSVVTAIFDIAADTRNKRVNGTLTNTDSGDQGTGNYGNYPLFIGRRNNATLPLNGNLYSLIIRGAQSSAAQISATEAWVNQRTGAY